MAEPDAVNARRPDGGLRAWCRVLLGVVAPVDLVDLTSDGLVASAFTDVGGRSVTAVATEPVTGNGRFAVARSVEALGSGARFDCCAVVGGPEIGDLETARRVVQQATSLSDVVAFCAPIPLDHWLGRWPTLWDALFAEHEFSARDVLRTLLWDDPDVDPVYSQASTVYVGPGAVARAESWPRSGAPRAIVHPARHAQALRAMVNRDAAERTSVELGVARQRLADADVALDEAAVDLDAAHRRVAVLEDELARHRAGSRPDGTTLAPAARRASSSRALRRRDHPAPRPVARFGGARRSTTELSRSLTALDDQIAALVDTAFYLERYPEVGPSGIDPVRHFLKYGLVERRDPCGWFDTAHYLAANPDIAASGVPPVRHYLASGWSEGRDPHPYFSGRYYLDQNLDVAASGLSPLLHYVISGFREGRSPHPLLDADTCARQAAALGKVVADPCGWWIGGAWHHGASPHWLFSVPWYAHRGPDVAAAGVDPLRHYLDHGWREHRSPHPLFDPSWYLGVYTDVEASGAEPLTHYLVSGRFEGRRPSPLFDPAWYRLEAGAALAGDEPCEHYLRAGRTSGSTPSRWARDLHEVAANA